MQAARVVGLLAAYSVAMLSIISLILGVLSIWDIPGGFGYAGERPIGVVMDVLRIGLAIFGIVALHLRMRLSAILAWVGWFAVGLIELLSPRHFADLMLAGAGMLPSGFYGFIDLGVIGWDTDIGIFEFGRPVWDVFKYILPGWAALVALVASASVGRAPQPGS